MGFGVWGLGFGVWGLGFGVRVNSVDKLRDAIREALDHDGPAIVEIMSDVELV